MRGVICERFGWTYDYLLYKIPWLDAYYMMIDAPRFIPDKPKPGENKNPATPGASAIPEEKAPQTDAEKLKSFLTKHL